MGLGLGLMYPGLGLGLGLVTVGLVNITANGLVLIKLTILTHHGQGSHVFNVPLTRAHHRDEIPERDVTYHLTCLPRNYDTPVVA